MEELVVSCDLDSQAVHLSSEYTRGSTSFSGFTLFCRITLVQVFGLAQKHCCLYLVDWTQDWMMGLDCGTALIESCARHFGKPEHRESWNGVGNIQLPP